MKGYFSIGKSCAIYDCLSSSRLKTIRRLGLYWAITVLRKCLPNEPVPPVTRTALSLRSSQGWEKSLSADVIGETLGTSGERRTAVAARELMNWSWFGKHISTERA